GEEDDVVATVWRPREEIGLDEARAVVADSCRRDGQHLRRRIHGGDARGMAEEQLSPRAGAARELEHTAGEPEAIERRNQLAPSWAGDCMVLVLAGDSAVVGELFDEQRLEFIGSTWKLQHFAGS